MAFRESVADASETISSDTYVSTRPVRAVLASTPTGSCTLCVRALPLPSGMSAANNEVPIGIDSRNSLSDSLDAVPIPGLAAVLEEVGPKLQDLAASVDGKNSAAQAKIRAAIEDAGIFKASEVLSRSWCFGPRFLLALTACLAATPMA